MIPSALDLERAQARDAVASHLADAKRVILTTHITPDGDGLGAALALLRHLRSRGAAADLINCSVAPQNLRFIYRKGEFALFKPEVHEPLLASCDTIIATDIGGSARLGRMEEPIRRSSATRIVFDHHQYENDLFDLALIEEDASSSAEVVYRLLRHIGASIPRELAEPLYIGLITDTGNFAYTATTPEAHRMAAELLETGVDPHQIWRRLNCQMPLPKMKVLGVCLSRLRLEHGGRIVWTSADLNFLARNRVAPRDAFEVVNHFLHLKDVEAGAFFMEITAARTKVSLRSTGKIDVCAIARQFGGGGHRFAAGCTLEGLGLSAAIPRILDDLGHSVAQLADTTQRE